jgi:hypothetical protein
MLFFKRSSPSPTDSVDYGPAIERIQIKLTQARQSGKSCYGSDIHNFQLEKPLSEKEVRSFESRYKIVLPGDFRQFLQKAGASGAGPYNGLLPLKDWDQGTQAGKDCLPSDFLARPCPLAPGAKVVMPASKVHGVEPLDQFIQGAIALVSQGCANFALLIVSGPAKGRVVYFSFDERDKVYFPENPNFLSWYERWLDELLAGYNADWFGYGADGAEEALAGRLLQEGISTEQKLEAIWTLRRIPRLSASTLEAISTASQGSDRDVRVSAENLLLDLSRPEGSDDA